MFIDTHMHVAEQQFNTDRDAVLSRAREAQVTTFIEIAESPAAWDAAVALAEKYPFIYASLGIHPHYAHEAGPDQWPALREKLKRLLSHPKVMAVGEFGLDYYRMRNTREQQQFLFRQQLELAREMDKPIVIHCRENERPKAGEPGREGNEESAHRDVQTALIEFFPDRHMKMALDRPNGVIHCFSGTWSDAQTYMMHGFLLGFDGPVTYPSSKLLQEIVRRMPLERMVLETDSPFLPPQTFRGQRNDPSRIPIIAEAISGLKRKTTEDVGTCTSKSARALFRLPNG